LPTMSFESNSTEALDLHNALSTLSPTQRAVALLHYYAGLNSTEIAAAIGVSPSTVRFHLMLARKALRKALSSPQIPLHASTEVS
jgi:RNA polymerase sigma factor (sigma-70 family)